MHTQPTRPEGRLLLKETRVFADGLRMLGRLARPVRAKVHCEPIIVLPGFGAGERSTRPLRNYLRRHGLTVEDWGLGANRAGLDIPHTIGDLGPTWAVEPKAAYRREGGVPMLCDRMVERVRERAQIHESKMVLVGWSLGGTIAREVARDAPDAVSHVITLGSPVVGGPKYTAAAVALEKRGLDMEWIEREVRKRESRPIQVPITAVVSPTDAIVGYQAARDHFSANVRHVEMDVAHLGMGINPRVWDVIVESLRGAH